MARQWPEGLADEVEAVLDERPCLVLERLPRGGGKTRWWVVSSLTEFAIVYNDLLAGGRVHLVPLGEQVKVGLPGPGLLDELRRHPGSPGAPGERVLGKPIQGSLEYEVSLLDMGELAEEVERLPSSSPVLYGVWPQFERIKFTTPDEDGEVRPQPV